MTQTHRFEIGELAYIKKYMGVSASRLFEHLMDFATVDQACVVLARDNDAFNVIEYYYVFLQYDQIRGWVHKYDLEKLDG
jgi:hypothetical protein